jgi:hypothetical protein
MLSFIGAVWLFLLAGLGDSQVVTAILDYGIFRGAYNPVYNISYWQKIPFAAPPVGENRYVALNL